jgi:exopolysaccharide biosynthesis protein
MNQGLVIKDGQVLQGLRQNKGWNSGAVGILYRDGTMKTFYLENEPLDPDREIKNGALYGWQFGPIIIRDHEPGPGATRYHGMGYKARNMLGVYEPGHYVIVTCDNRGEDARGMNELMMVDIMKSLGVKDAFNLDGGTSAVMVFMGKVINRPTLRNDNGTMVEGRPLLDMLIFGECGEDGSFRDLSTLTPSKTKD